MRETIKTEATYDKWQDTVTIKDVSYSGEITINRIVNDANFTITFQSGVWGTAAGFVLNWKCTEWGQWSVLADGTCRQVMKPRFDSSTMSHTYFRYRKSNKTCSELSFRVLGETTRLQFHSIKYLF